MLPVLAADRRFPPRDDINPQYVKPFVLLPANDGNDAEATVTAAKQPHIPHVPKKTIEQKDIQAMRRARQRMVNHTARPRCREAGSYDELMAFGGKYSSMYSTKFRQGVQVANFDSAATVFHCRRVLPPASREGRDRGMRDW